MCVALLYSVCVCTCERNTSACCISCWFVFCSNFIQANSLGDSLYTCGLDFFPVESCCCSEMHLLCKKTSRLLSLVIPERVQQWQAGPACWQLCAQSGCGVSWPWRQGLACKFVGTALIRLLCLCYFSCGATLCSCFFLCLE